MWTKTGESIVHATLIDIRLKKPVNNYFFMEPNKIFAWIGPSEEPIEIPCTWRYMVSLKLKETDSVTDAINSTKTLSGKEGTDLIDFDIESLEK